MQLDDNMYELNEANIWMIKSDYLANEIWV